ncbi:uncharacterized protein LOC141617671 [Silene latifolia]|uniref:uncharacterized protein LOC141617671 n=1 Tax=Silene latifolia TaxID=37657 RepID=UPI003D779AA8
MAEEDMNKTTFTSKWGTYCYTVMPFGLINAGATYQRTATKLLHDMMNYKEVEVYVDDIIVKSKERGGHLGALGKFFQRLRKYNMRLNPQKCAFGVTSGKLLAHIVSHRGIKVNPTKIKAIMEMPRPKTEKETRVIKGRAVADFLADNQIEETEVVDTWSFLDEDVVHVENDVWDLYFDGASNYMRYGVGIILISPTGEHVPVSNKLDFNVTNNAAEYEACLLGLRSALDLGVKKLLVHRDSSLVINKVGGSWRIKSQSLAPYQTKIEELEKYFEDIRYVHLPRVENQFADTLFKLAAINIPDHVDSMPICVKRRSSPAYVNAIDNAEEGETAPWYTTILKFKETGDYPPDLDTRGKRALRMLSAQFIRTDDGQLYKKTAQGILLRCIDKPTAEKVIEEVHDGECGPHMNAYMLVRKIIRLDYYWTTMETDCYNSDFENEAKGEQVVEEEEEVEPPPQLVRGLEKYDQRNSVIEDTETINVEITLEQQELKIGTTLDPVERQGFIDLLIEFKDVFAWSYKDMPGIHRKIAEHRIPIKPGFKPVKQKLRRMRLEWSLKVKEEIDKQLKAGFIKVS